MQEQSQKHWMLANTQSRTPPCYFIATRSLAKEIYRQSFNGLNTLHEAVRDRISNDKPHYNMLLNMHQKINEIYANIAAQSNQYHHD